MDKNEENKVLTILKGRLYDLPKQQSKIVSIFLSSTFKDFKLERNYLIETAYPKLQKYCKETYGLEFQIIDMRWGLKSNGRNMNLSTEFCIEEVDRCNRISAKPCFIALISHRFGAIYLPTKIAENEFKTLKNEMTKTNNISLYFAYEDSNLNFDTTDIVEYCYKLDENCQPNIYKLLDLYSIMVNLNSNKLKPSSTLNWSRDIVLLKNMWKKVEDTLVNIFQKAASICFEKSLISDQNKENYFRSITEKECYEGILNVADAKKQSLLFVRDIVDIENRVKTNNDDVKNYIDLDENRNIDVHNKQRLKNLKELIQHTNGKKYEKNIFNYPIEWDKIKSEEYLRKFAKDFYKNVKKLIDSNQNSSERFVSENNDLINEILLHSYFCNKIVSKFEEREISYTAIENYIKGNNNEPFIIHGSSGCGKTSLIAKLAERIPEFVLYPEDTVVILRFLGTTPLSSNVTSVFRSILEQLDQIYDLKTSKINYKTFNSVEMKNALIDCFKEIERKHPDNLIVIFLDSLDQLQRNDYLNLEWVPLDYPPVVKFIYSTITDYENILINFKKLLTKKDENLLEIKSLSLDEANTIFNKFLRRTDKRIQQSQRDTVEQLFKKSESELYPLFVKLNFEIVSEWPSFYNDYDKYLKCIKTELCIDYIFELLENDYGKLLVSKCLFYLTTSGESGISDMELEDVLSLDDELLSDIFEYHYPPIRRFPITLWNRIKHRLNEYITQKQIYNVQVNMWYHRKFIEVAKSRYVDCLDENSRETYYLNLLDVFTEKWKDEPKSYEITKDEAKKRNLKTTEDKAKRYTSAYPLKFNSNQYNLRKINRTLEVMAQIMDMYTLSKILLENFLLNYDFSLAVYKSQQNFQFYYYYMSLKSKYLASKYVDYEYLEDLLITITRIYNSNATLFNTYPKSIYLYLTSCCLCFYGISKMITNYIDYTDNCDFDSCPLLAFYQLKPLTDGQAAVSFNLSKGIQCIQLYDDEFMLDGKVLYKLFCQRTNYTCEEIALPINEENYSILRIYRNDNDYICIVGTKKQLVCINQIGIEICKPRIVNGIIKDVDFIDHQKILVYYENENYFDVISVIDGKCIKRRNFDSKIKLLRTNTSKAWIVSKSSQNLFVSLLLDDGTFMIMEFKADLGNKLENNRVEINILYELKFTESMPNSFYIKCSRTKNFKQAVFLTFKESNCLFIEIDKNNKVDGTIIKFKELECDLRLKSLTDNLAIIQSKRNLHIFDTIKKKWVSIEIDNNYKHIFSYTLDAYKVIYAYVDDTLDVYLVQFQENDTTKILHIVESTQFDDEILYIDAAEHQNTFENAYVYLKNSCRVIFSIKQHIFSLVQDFERVDYRIDEIVQLSDTLVLTYANKKNIFTVWDIINGKICNSSRVSSDSKIKNINKCNKHIIVLYAKKKSILVDVHKIKFKETIEIKKKATFELSHSKHAQILVDEDSYSFMIFDLGENLKFVVTCIKFDRETEEWCISYTNKLSLTDHTEMSIKEGFTKNLYCVTEKNNYFVFANRSTFLWIDLKLGKKLNEINYASKNKIKAIKIQSLIKSDSVICLFDNNVLVVFKYNSDAISIIEKEIKDYTCLDFTVFRDNIAVLSEKARKYVKLWVFDVKNDEIKTIFGKKFDLNTLELYKITPNGNYLVIYEKTKLLSLIRLSNSETIIEVPLFRPVQNILLTNQFIILDINDKRLLSYFIKGSTSEESIQRIKQWRDKKRKLTKNDVGLCLITINIHDDKSVDILKEALKADSNSSSEQEDGNNEYSNMEEYTDVFEYVHNISENSENKQKEIMKNIIKKKVKFVSNVPLTFENLQ